ncbi:unnamed protein product [Protopolystoma xenopodis]|uniref:Uncharacterized protein n=1 Tax=Protopolystoma xenopodis TaxID=117903 RepID=A0A448XRJ7_9PLAT|nr:unnamed protein product [Protopolystoma xenopodis]
MVANDAGDVADPQSTAARLPRSLLARRHDSSADRERWRQGLPNAHATGEDGDATVASTKAARRDYHF